jgi:hypothetical protein
VTETQKPKGNHYFVKKANRTTISLWNKERRTLQEAKDSREYISSEKRDQQIGHMHEQAPMNGILKTQNISPPSNA